MTGPAPDETIEWRPVADGVWVTTVEPDTVNLGLVAGAESCLLVDCGSSAEQGAAVRRSVTAVTGTPLAGLVVTHGHRDHVGGLAAFADVATIGSTALPVGPGEPRFSRPVALVTAVDLGGGRRVEIAHLGEGHTAADLVVVVADADLVFAGDLVESAGPPWYGADSSPGQWPATLDGLIGLLGEHSVVVPGHGALMTRQDVFRQRSELAAVAGELRHLAETGVPLAEAADRGTWPYPVKHIAPGLAAGYAEVGVSGALAGRRLPLV